MNQSNSTKFGSNVTIGCDWDTISKPTRNGLTCAYVIIFIAALIGNSVVIYIVKSKNKIKITFNYFILSMAAADLMHAFLVVPVTIAFLFVGTKWFSGSFGFFLCKFVHYGIVVSIVASITTLTITAIRTLPSRQAVAKEASYHDNCTTFGRGCLGFTRCWFLSTRLLNTQF